MAEQRETSGLAIRQIGGVFTIGVAMYLLGVMGATFPILGAVIWMVLGLAFPVLCVIGALYTRGYQRVFFIGGLFPAVLTLAVAVTLFVVMTFDPGEIEHFDSSEFGLPITWLLIVGCGTLASRTSQWLGVIDARGTMEEGEFGDNQSTHSLWQFSLWSLMIAITLCAIACAILFVLPPIFSVSICLVLWTVSPIVATVAMIHGGPERRDFWVGVAFPAAAGFAAVTCVFVIAAIDEGGRFLFDDDLALGLQIVTGLLAVSALLLGKLAAIFGRRMRSLQDEQENS